MSPKIYNTDMNTRFHSACRGILLVDIILAFSLATIFIAIITSSSSSARIIFERAKGRQEVIRAFGTSTDITTYPSNSLVRPYGNDLIEHIFSTTTAHGAEIFFNKIDAPTNLSDYIGTPLCSVDFLGQNNLAAKNIKITPIPLPINPLLPLTDFQVRNGVTYISSDSSTASDPDLFVIDFKDLTRPKLLSSINTGPGISAITLAGNRIFAAADSTSAQLHIIRLEDATGLAPGPTSLVLEKKYKLPLPEASTTPSHGSAVFFYKNKIYLGTDKWNGEELSIIDVSDPINPLKVGGFEMNGKVKDVFAHSGFAYVAGSDQQQFRTLDISDPTSPRIVSSLSPSGWSRQEGTAISLFENAVDFGRTSGGFNIVADHEFFTASSSLDIPGGVYGIIQDRFHTYLATRQVDEEFQIFESRSGDSDSEHFATSTSLAFSLPVAPQQMTCDGNRVYILAGTAPVIYEVSFVKFN